MITTPLTLTSPVIIKSDSIERQQMLCSYSGPNGKISLFPWEAETSTSSLVNAVNVNAFGVDPLPCIFTRHSSTVSSLIANIVAMPLSRAVSNLLHLEAATPAWRPVALPFLIVYQSSCAIRDSVVSGFGVLSPSSPAGNPQSTALSRLRGGCVGAYASALEISRSTLELCVAEEGAGVFALSGELNVQMSMIRDNVAVHRGGGISMSGATAQIWLTELRNNSVLSVHAFPSSMGVSELASVAGGGALYCFGMQATPVRLQNVMVLWNVVDTRRTSPRDVGGGMAWSYCDFLINNVTVKFNRVGPNSVLGVDYPFTTPVDTDPQALLRGGGMYASQSSGILQDSHFFENFAASAGGNIAFQQCGKVTIDTTELWNGRAQFADGGGLAIDGLNEPVTIRSVLFQNNHATRRHGGALAVLNLGDNIFEEQVLLEGDTLFMGNSAAFGGGGALYFTQASVGSNETIEDILDSAWLNSASYGPHLGTDPRSIRATALHSPLLVQPESSIAEGHLLVEVLDLFGHVVTSVTDVIVEAASPRLIDPSPESAAVPPYLLENLASFTNGIADMDGLRVMARPGSHVKLRMAASFAGTLLTSNEVEVYIAPCPPGTSLQANQVACSTCPLGTVLRNPFLMLYGLLSSYFKSRIFLRS